MDRRIKFTLRYLQNAFGNEEAKVLLQGQYVPTGHSTIEWYFKGAYKNTSNNKKRWLGFHTARRIVK